MHAPAAIVTQEKAHVLSLLEEVVDLASCLLSNSFPESDSANF